MNCSAFPSGDKLIVAGFQSRVLLVWDLNRNEIVGISFFVHDVDVSFLTISTDWKLVATCGINNRLSVWEWKVSMGVGQVTIPSFAESIAFF